jgi:hypothetical protein
MLTKLDYTVLPNLIQEALQQLPDDFKLAINKPTGRFFYDAWEIKDEFKDSALDNILKTLPEPIGEARLINLLPGQCYQSHSDLDDRYHLNLSGDDCFLIDIDSRSLHELVRDGHWYAMNAGPRHSAANFGQVCRTQLVVRKLLTLNELVNPVKIKLTAVRLDDNDARFFFDQSISVWLNQATKNGLITDFNYTPAAVTFTIERVAIDDFKTILYPEFEMEIL